MTVHGISSRARVVLQIFRIVLVGLLGAWLAVIFAGGVKTAVGPVTVQGEMRPAWSGETRLGLPPAGTLSAATHRGPLALVARVEEVEVASLARWVKRGVNGRALPDWLRPEVARLAATLAWRGLLAAVVGAAVFGLLAGLRRRQWLACVLAGAGSVAIPLALAALTYDPGAFSDARYTGELARAPALLRMANLNMRQLTSLQGNLSLAADRAEVLTERLDDALAAPSPAVEPTRVLLVSDLHNNPAGLQLAVDLAESYDVKLVLVAGDISDLGHPLEGGLLTEWTKFRVPVVVVTGNHDSRAIAGRLRQIKGVTVLENGARVQRAGLTIGGYGDPRAERDGLGSAENTPEELDALFTRVSGDLQGAAAPDILLLHNHRTAQRLLGRAPVILTGHSHAAEMRRDGESVLVNAGTAGAAGVRYFTAKHRPDYGAAILSFVPGVEPKLRYVDFVQVTPADGDFVVQRRDLARWKGELFWLR
ncbi:MAG: metallophosphoesterase family protein [Armatimonadota bacterium]